MGNVINSSWQCLKGYCLSFCSNLEKMKNLSSIDFKVISSLKEQLFISLFAFISKFNRNMIWKLPPFNFYHPWQKLNPLRNWLVIWLILVSSHFKLDTCDLFIFLNNSTKNEIVLQDQKIFIIMIDNAPLKQSTNKKKLHKYLNYAQQTN
jgi:hypothetical protein